MIFRVFASCFLLASPLFAMSEAELRELIGDAKFGPQIELPAGTITLSSPLVISDRAHFRMCGRGEEATLFAYEGDPDQPAIVLEHCLRSTIEGFGIRGKCAVGVSIRTRKNPPGWPISSENIVRDVGVGKGAKTGFFVDSHGWDGNNEFHRFESCTASWCEEAAYRIWGSQAHRIQFNNCSGSFCERLLWGEHGNYWTWRNGQGTGNAVDFEVGSFWFKTTIDEHRSEGSKAFFHTSKGWSMMPVSIRNVTWDGKPDAWKFAVDIQGNGPVTVEHSTFTSNNGNPILFRVWDHDPGILSVSGLSLVTGGNTNGDYSQRPIATPQRIASEGRYYQEVRSGKPWQRFVDSLERPMGDGVVVQLGKERFEPGDTLEVDLPLPAAGYDRLRSFTITADLACDEMLGWVKQVMSVCGMDVQQRGRLAEGDLFVPGRIQYNRGSWEPEKKYPFVLSYSRDYGYFGNAEGFGMTIVKWGDAVNGYASREGPLSSDAPRKLVIGSDRFSGSVSNVRVYDRAFSGGELR